MLIYHFTSRGLARCGLLSFITLNFFFVFFIVLSMRSMFFGFSLLPPLLSVFYASLLYIPTIMLLLLHCKISKLLIRRFIRIFLLVIFIQCVCVEIFCFLDERHFMSQVRQNPEISYERARLLPSGKLIYSSHTGEYCVQEL